MRKLNTADLESMRIPRRFWQARFEDVGGPYGDRNGIKESIAGYLQRIDLMREKGAGLLLWGNNGTGKTSIGSLIMMQARRCGFTGLFLNCADIKTIVTTKEMYDAESGLTLWARAKRVDFLLLDDLGKGSQDSQGFGERLLDELLRARYADKCCTIITTNVIKKELTNFIKPSTLHILKGSMAQIKVVGHDFRIAEGEEIRQLINGGKQ